MSKIFGSKKSGVSSEQSSGTTTTSNNAYPQIQQDFGGLTGQAQTGANSLSALLGGDSSGFDAFKRATGFDTAAKMGSQGITGNAAAGGLLRSGGTAKALQNFGTNLQDQFAGSYMDRLLQQVGIGQNAGQLLASTAGTTSNQTGTKTGQVSEKSKPGLGGLLGYLGVA